MSGNYSPLPLPAEIQAQASGHGLIFYDGDCSFCRFWVRFVSRRDQAKYFVFVSLGDPWVREWMGRSFAGNTVLLYESGKLYDRSTAALRIVSALPWWGLVRVFLWIPKGLRDWVYLAIARRRHRFKF